MADLTPTIKNTVAKKYDIRDYAKWTSALALGGAALYGFSKYVLPFLLKTVWEGTALIAGLVVLAFLLMLVTNPKFWRALAAINYIIIKNLTFWVITWDDFAYQEMEINESAKGRDEIRNNMEILSKQAQLKEDELAIAKRKMDEASATIRTLQARNNPEEEGDLDLAALEFSRQQEFINDITPLYQQILDLRKMLEVVYKQTDLKIKDARAELAMQKAKLESYNAGQSAMQSAYRILMGDLGMSEDARIAREAVKQKIALKIGSIRTTLDIIAPVMRERQIKDKTKVTMALDSLKKLEIEGTPVTMAIPVARPLTNKLLS